MCSLRRLLAPLVVPWGVALATIGAAGLVFPSGEWFAAPDGRGRARVGVPADSALPGRELIFEWNPRSPLGCSDSGEDRTLGDRDRGLFLHVREERARTRVTAAVNALWPAGVVAVWSAAWAAWRLFAPVRPGASPPVD